MVKGQKKDSNKKNFQFMLTPEKLPILISNRKSDKNIFPEDPLERCNLRWANLFFGVWKSLNENDQGYRKIKLGIIEALKKFGLFGKKTFPSELFELNPTDEILRKVEAFKESPWIPDLRGKKLPWERYDPLLALFDYSSTLFIINKLPRRFNNPVSYKLKVKERLPEILEKMDFKRRKYIPEELLNKWIKLPRNEFIVRLVAYIHGFRPDAFKKYLIRARQEHPDLAKLWKYGMEKVKVISKS